VEVRNLNPRESPEHVQFVEQGDHGTWCAINAKSTQSSWRIESREQERRFTHWHAAKGVDIMAKQGSYVKSVKME